MAFCVRVESQVFGEGQGRDTLPIVEVTLDQPRTTVRELIAKAVQEQITTLRRSSDTVSLTLARQYLSRADVELQAQAGQIAMPAARRTETVDIATEIERAHRGFAAQAFRVVVDGEILGELDQPIALAANSKIIFLRLLPLVGG